LKPKKLKAFKHDIRDLGSYPPHPNPQKMKGFEMFYIAKNSYSNPTNIGFSNTWFVVGFTSRVARDAYVFKCPNLATKAITASEIRKYGGSPKKVSYFDANGQYYIHMGQGEFFKQID